MIASPDLGILEVSIYSISGLRLLNNSEANMYVNTVLEKKLHLANTQRNITTKISKQN